MSAAYEGMHKGGRNDRPTEPRPVQGIPAQGTTNAGERERIAEIIYKAHFKIHDRKGPIPFANLIERKRRDFLDTANRILAALAPAEQDAPEREEWIRQYERLKLAYVEATLSSPRLADEAERALDTHVAQIAAILPERPEVERESDDGVHLDLVCALNIGKERGLDMDDAAAHHLESALRRIVREETMALVAAQGEPEWFPPRTRRTPEQDAPERTEWQEALCAGAMALDGILDMIEDDDEHAAAKRYAELLRATARRPERPEVEREKVRSVLADYGAEVWALAKADDSKNLPALTYEATTEILALRTAPPVSEERERLDKLFRAHPGPNNTTHFEAWLPGRHESLLAALRAEPRPQPVPGTVERRFQWLCDEVRKRGIGDEFDSLSTPEMDLLKAYDALAAAVPREPLACDGTDPECDGCAEIQMQAAWRADPSNPANDQPREPEERKPEGCPHNPSKGGPHDFSNRRDPGRCYWCDQAEWASQPRDAQPEREP